LRVPVLLLSVQLASGEVFGKNQPIALQLLGSQRSREALEGVAMELEDSLYPLLREVRGERGHTWGHSALLGAQRRRRGETCWRWSCARGS
jgi:hypothetical protein